MKSKQEWMDEFARRQDNIDPIRRIPNVALFQGTLIKGNSRLNKFQRIGAVVLGVMGVMFGCFLLLGGMLAIKSRNFANPLLPALVLSPLSLWFSLRILKNALLNDPKKRSQADKST